jgi:predicted nucleic acid-binding protein
MGKDMADSRYIALVQSGLQICDLTSIVAKEAGFLKSKHKNIPIGDFIIAAIAAENQARILSDDYISMKSKNLNDAGYRVALELVNGASFTPSFRPSVHD